MRLIRLSLRIHVCCVVLPFRTLRCASNSDTNVWDCACFLFPSHVSFVQSECVCVCMCAQFVHQNSRAWGVNCAQCFWLSYEDVGYIVVAEAFAKVCVCVCVGVSVRVSESQRTWVCNSHGEVSVSWGVIHVVVALLVL